MDPSEIKASLTTLTSLKGERQTKSIMIKTEREREKERERERERERVSLDIGARKIYIQSQYVPVSF